MWKRLCCVPTTWVWQLLSLTTPFGEGSTSVLVSVEWMCQQPWWHPQWSLCCYASEHTMLLSENKCFSNVGARLYFVDLPSIFEEPACEKPNLWGAGSFFLLFAHYSHGTSLHQSSKKNNLWEIFFRQFLSTGKRAVNWHIFLCQNSFGFL